MPFYLSRRTCLAVPSVKEEASRKGGSTIGCSESARSNDDFLPVVAGVPPANSGVQPTRLPLQIYFGANEATIFSKRGSSRSGIPEGQRLIRPYRVVA